MTLVDGAIRVAQTALGTALAVLAMAAASAAFVLALPWRGAMALVAVAALAAFAALAWRARTPMG